MATNQNHAEQQTPFVDQGGCESIGGVERM